MSEMATDPEAVQNEPSPPPSSSTSGGEECSAAEVSEPSYEPGPPTGAFALWQEKAVHIDSSPREESSAEEERRR